MDFPAKILLFGEYGILLNSMALAIPCSLFSGQFRFSDASADRPPERKIESNEELKRLLNYLKNDIGRFRFLHLERFEEEINREIYFDSSIPSGFGLGSSGALTAALYERYATDYHNNEYLGVKTRLAAIETCFHGLSSGIDPLTSFLRKPVFADSANSSISTPDLSKFLATYSLFLVNSHSKGNTHELVSHFMEQYHQSEFREKIDHEYVPIINQTICAAITENFGSIDSLIARYSRFQLINFAKLIPEAMRKHFEYGIESGIFYLKLCGSGGGGYMLAISRNRLKAEVYFNLKHLEYKLV
jgi:mevalonate kinase